MPAEANNWGPAALIVFGYIVAAFWQNKRIDDLKDWIKAEFSRVDEHFQHVDENFRHVNEKLDRLDVRVKALEDARTSGVLVK